jgi:hypothetical protein
MTSELLRRGVTSETTAPHTGTLDPEAADAAAALGTTAPDRRHRGPRARHWFLLGLAAVPVVAVALGYLSLRSSAASDIGDYGLIEALRPQYFVALVLVTGGFLTFLWTAPRRTWLGVLYVAALTALVEGAAFVIEGEPRFPVTYVHVGFTEAIMRTGETLPLIDARFSWPGFFSLFGYLSEVAGFSDPMVLATWYPFIVKALWLAAAWVILQRLVRHRAACWLAMWLFVLLEWTGQSYFSPQALGMFTYLVCVAVLVVLLDPRRTPGPENRWAIGVVIAAYAALVVSHQLSPFMIMAAAGLLGVLGLTRARSLWVIFMVLFLVWFSFGTYDYWTGHMDDIFGSAGKVSETIDDNVGDRMRGNVAHERVVYSRILLALGVWGLAALGCLIAWRRHRLDGRLVVLGAAPMCALVLQSYGGEGLIRVFLFVLPAAAGAAALVFFAARGGWPRRLSRVALALLLVAVLPVSLLAKYGNESFEAVTPGELRMTAWLHEHTGPGDLVATIAPAGLLRSQRVGEVDYVPALDDFQTGNLTSVGALMRDHSGRRFLALSESQYAYGLHVTGLPRGWEQELLADLERSTRFILVYRDGTNIVYQLPTRSP